MKTKIKITGTVYRIKHDGSIVFSTSSILAPQHGFIPLGTLETEVDFELPSHDVETQQAIRSLQEQRESLENTFKSQIALVDLKLKELQNG